MTQVPFMISNRSINILLQGKMWNVDSSHPYFEEITEALKGEHDEKALLELVSIPKSIEGKTFGRVIVGEDAIYYKGKPVHNEMTSRIMDMIAQGFDVEMWALFMDNLMSNPIESAREELYVWMEKAGLPLTSDGCFIAYKRVNADYSSMHKGPGNVTVYNHIGTMVEMPEGEEVDLNRNSTCSHGLHFCSPQYLNWYYNTSNSLTLILKINPADVRAIPSDHDDQKGRAIRYMPIAMIESDNLKDAFGDSAVVTSFDQTPFLEVNDEEEYDAYLDEYTSLSFVDCNDDDYGIIPTDRTKSEYTITHVTSDKVDRVLEPKRNPPTKNKVKYGGKWTAFQLLRLVSKVGSVRGAARAENVSKSTMQDWVRKAKTERGEAV